MYNHLTRENMCHSGDYIRNIFCYGGLGNKYVIDYYIQEFENVHGKGALEQTHQTAGRGCRKMQAAHIPFASLPQLGESHRENRQRRDQRRPDGLLPVLLRRKGHPRPDESLRQMRKQSSQIKIIEDETHLIEACSYTKTVLEEN